MPNLQTVEQDYRRYALYEKGHQAPTVQQSLSILHRLCEFCHTEELRHMDTSLIRSFLQSMREKKGWSAKTFRIYRQSLKTFFDWAELEGYVTANPVERIGVPPLPAALPRCLTREQALRFLSYSRLHDWCYPLEGPRNEAIIATFLLTGLRLSELINLRVNDVFFDSGELHVLRGKNQKDRIITIHPRLKPYLFSYRTCQSKWGKPSVWFFSSVKSDNKLTPRNVQTVCRKISKSSGVKATPHMLRHTCGRLYVEANANLRVIQSLLGHSRIETTETYTHVSSEAMKAGLSRSCPFG